MGSLSAIPIALSEQNFAHNVYIFRDRHKTRICKSLITKSQWVSSHFIKEEMNESKYLIINWWESNDYWFAVAIDYCGKK